MGGQRALCRCPWGSFKLTGGAGQQLPSGRVPLGSPRRKRLGWADGRGAAASRRCCASLPPAPSLLLEENAGGLGISPPASRRLVPRTERVQTENEIQEAGDPSASFDPASFRARPRVSLGRTFPRRLPRRGTPCRGPPRRHAGRVAAGLSGPGGLATSKGPAAVARRSFERSTAAWRAAGSDPPCQGTMPWHRGGGWPPRQGPLVSGAACVCGARPVAAREPRHT